ncbi:DoxX family membrane protein [Pelobium sp.]|nr:DoxX family membrane protein [Pelobium sp.]MDA9555073.1 DoxX family membrane protein [Pelobium sp.]
MKKKILFVICLLFGLMMVNAGLDKFLHYMPMPEKMPEKLTKVFHAFIEIGWLLPLVGLTEIIGGILFIIPKTRALAALILLPVLVGILLTNTITEQSGLPIALILIGIEFWVIYENKEKYLPIIK